MSDDREPFQNIGEDAVTVTDVEPVGDPASKSDTEERTPYLVVMAGPDVGRAIELAEGISTVGRWNDCDVTLIRSEISRKHARLSVDREEEEYWIEDLGSTNGTFVADERIEGREEISDGTRIRFGSDTLATFMLQDQVDQSFYRDLHENAIRDSLTGVYSKDYVAKQLRHLTGNLEELDDPVYVVLADIDGFEDVNDTYGHPTGDAALEQVAEVLRAEAEKQGVTVGRYGGDEFILFFQSLEDGDPESFLADLVGAVEEEAFKHEETALGLTVSVGAASTEIAKDDELSRVLYAADSALYRAKENGGNTFNARFGNGSSASADETLTPF